MMRTDIYGMVPGLTTAAETYETAFYWGGDRAKGRIAGGLIDSAAIDAGNSPTWELRAGLLLGKKFATGTWTNYSPTAVDGSEVAAGVLLEAVRMQDFQGNFQQRFYGICVGGPVQAGKLLGLDYNARQAMRGNFQFDDDYPGNIDFPWKRVFNFTAAYSVLVSDNGTLFTNSGAAGSLVITLPAIQNGLVFGFKVFTAQTIVITSNEGGNILMDNNASASTATLAARVGTGARVYSNPAGTKWFIDYMGAQGGANATIT